MRQPEQSFLLCFILFNVLIFTYVQFEYYVFLKNILKLNNAVSQLNMPYMKV